MNHHQWKRITPESCARNGGFAWRWWGVDNSHLWWQSTLLSAPILRFTLAEKAELVWTCPKPAPTIGSSIWADFMGDQGQMCQPPGVHVEWKKLRWWSQVRRVWCHCRSRQSVGLDGRTRGRPSSRWPDATLVRGFRRRGSSSSGMTQYECSRRTQM